ncbi:hypothetical protein STENM327S_03350 [Streptomyces tendae]
MRLDDVQGVAAAGVVGVPAGVGLEAVVAAVVDALQGERRAQLTRLRRVVVDHVEDHLDAGRVQRADHPLELADLPTGGAGGGVGGVRGEVADRVVAPVVLQAALQQMALVRELVHRQQLHRRHAQPCQVLDRRRVREARVGAAQLGRDAGVELGEAAHVQLVDDRVRPRRLGPAVVRPVVVVMDHDALGDVRRRVTVVAHGVRHPLLGPVPHMAVHLGRQAEVAVHGAGVRVQEQLRRVPAGAGPRVPAAVHPVTVALPGPDARHEAVPDPVRQLGQPHPALPGTGARPVEQAQLDRLRPARPQGEVGPRHLVGAGPEPGAERHRGARPGRHGGRRRGPPRAIDHDGGATVRGGPLPGHRLPLGCAGHLSASHGSWNDVRQEGVRRPGRCSPSRRPPHSSAHRVARTHVSPGPTGRYGWM